MPKDEGLRCPFCRYNLTGLLDERCPECGQGFDLQQLREDLPLRPDPIPGWDDGERNVISAFIHMCLMTWFHPRAFHRSFPSCYSRRSAWLFRLSALLVALVVYGLAVVLLNRTGEMVFFSITLPGVICGPPICEFIVSLLFTIIIPPPADGEPGPQASGSWIGFVGFFRSHFILSAVLVGPVTVLSFSNPASRSWTVFWCMAVVSCLLWWISLGTAISATSYPRVSRAAAILSIPVAAVVSVILAVILNFGLVIMFAEG
ncbi:MAG: hypothetical protein AMXMBFR13_02350 [Phycisphaerae bacterium]